MGTARAPTPTVTFVDEYCATYRDLFEDVRSFEHLCLLHLGLISDLPRKSLPAIAHRVGADPQALHHFVANADWSLDKLREKRLELTRQALRERPFVLIIDETGDLKKGKTTDYVARQYIGNLGTVDRGIVSVSAYGVLDNVTFPLRFQTYKPESRLKPGDTYLSKPTIAIDLVRGLVADGFKIKLVLADALYGESGPFIGVLEELKLPYVVAIRENHGVWMRRGERVRSTRWRPFQRLFSNGSAEKRYIRELVFGKRHRIRYYELTSDPEKLPAATTRFVMTNLEGDLRHTLGNFYGLRTWIEYGYKQIKDELGWADYRLTDYHDIERWWELVFSAYLMVSLQTPVLAPVVEPAAGELPSSPPSEPARVTQHPWWDPELSWKRTLNNLRLLIQPFCALCLLLPWMTVFPVPGLIEQLRYLIACINGST
jgi:SRSO17 transposase